MKCHHCGFENPEGVRFCGQCATEVNRSCPQCGAANPANFKFCGQCATALAGAPAPAVAAVPSSTVQQLADSILDPQRHIEGERRNISVVFVDVRSFTPFSESLDPEEVYEAVDVFLRALVEQVQQFGGHVDKFTGDGLMALFGAPVAHENDPERAVRAAWGMQQALRQLAETETWSAPVALNARIGVNTGTVVVADVGADVNYTAMGDVVNVAARLEQNAEPGGVLVSASTYEFTHPFFEFEAIGPLQVKGRQEPIETFKVVGEKARPGTLRGARGLRAPLVGREAELARLRSIAAALTDTGQGSLVILTGEAGIGKSRLTAELRSSLEQTPVTFLVGEAVSYGRSAAYEVFARILRRFFRIEPGAAPNTARERLRALLAALDPDLNTSAQVYIENLIGLPLTEPDARRLARLEPQQLRQQTFLAIRTLLSAAAAVEPVVLVFEDLHWIDELSLELLLFLLKSVEQNALLLYGTTRPDEGVALQRIDEMARTELGERYQRIELEPLSRQDSRSLITSLLDVPSLPAQLSALITEKAEGNPFFTEELIGVLIDRGIVEPAGDGWQLRPDVDYSEFDVPLTLDGLIMARVDSMGPQARQVLQHAAVIGRRFELPLLRQLLNGAGAALADVIVLMEERGFITPLPAAATKAYEFRHGLMRDSVYNSLLFRKRRELHGLAAAAIETIQPQRPEDEPELLAFHYSRSDTPQRALPYTISAGHRARRRFANHEAVDYYNQALTLLADDADASVERRLEVFTGLGEVQDFSGEYEAAVTSYKQALAVLESTGVSSGETVADVQRRLGRVYERWGDYTRAMRWLDTGLSTLDQAQAAEDNAHRALIYKDKGMLLFRQGSLGDAIKLIERSLPVLEQFDYSSDIASAYNALAGLYYNSGVAQRALEHAEKGLVLREELGDSYGIANSRNNLGLLTMNLGHWDEAQEHLARGLELYEKIGNVVGTIITNHNLGLIARWRGEYDIAEARFNNALSSARSISHKYSVASSLKELGEQAILQQDHEAALVYLDEAGSLAAETGARDLVADVEWLRGWVHLEQIELQEAEQHVDSAIRIARETGAKEAHASALRVQGMLYRFEGKLLEARAAFSESLKVFEKLNNKYQVALSQFELGRTYAVEALDYPDGAPQLSAEAAGLISRAIDAFAALGAQPDMARARMALMGTKGTSIFQPAETSD